MDLSCSKEKDPLGGFESQFLQVGFIVCDEGASKIFYYCIE